MQLSLLAQTENFCHSPLASTLKCFTTNLAQHLDSSLLQLLYKPHCSIIALLLLTNISLIDFWGYEVVFLGLDCQASILCFSQSCLSCLEGSPLALAKTLQSSSLASGISTL